jgi:hypothetical protein
VTLAPAETFFPTSARGVERDRWLTNFRFGLRQLTNPDTNLPFTDSEISVATNEKSDAYRRADALDAVLFVMQQRGLYLSQQWDPRRANTSMLANVHGYLWELKYLPESGGSGPIVDGCNPLTTVVGSTTLGDPAAAKLTDPAQKLYQVLFTVQAGFADTTIELNIAAIDGGSATNLTTGTKLQWVNKPIGVIGEPEVTADFTGGGPKETDMQFALRVLRELRHKQGAGNRAQQRAWAEQAARNAVESAFVYSCAFHAGSFLVAIVQRRGDVEGPTGGQPSIGTLAAVTEYIVPPASPVQPAHAHVVVTGWTAEPTNMVINLSMPAGTDAGWADLQPWPGTSGGNAAAITAINVGGDPLVFRMEANVALPSGVTQPQLMIWNATTSRWIELAVLSIAPVAGTVYDIELSLAPTGLTLAVGQFVSPHTERAEPLALAIEAFFDSLGPGEVIDVSTSSANPRRPRAARFPKPSEEYPMRAGTNVLTFIQDAFGSGIADLDLVTNTVSLPSLPTDPVLGPKRIVAGKIAVYAF